MYVRVCGSIWTKTCGPTKLDVSKHSKQKLKNGNYIFFKLLHRNWPIFTFGDCRLQVGSYRIGRVTWKLIHDEKVEISGLKVLGKQRILKFLSPAPQHNVSQSVSVNIASAPFQISPIRLKPIWLLTNQFKQLPISGVRINFSRKEKRIFITSDMDSRTKYITISKEMDKYLLCLLAFLLSPKVFHDPSSIPRHLPSLTGFFSFPFPNSLSPLFCLSYRDQGPFNRYRQKTKIHKTFFTTLFSRFVCAPSVTKSQVSLASRIIWPDLIHRQSNCHFRWWKIVNTTTTTKRNEMEKKTK